jgi:hypothetical protein
MTATTLHWRDIPANTPASRWRGLDLTVTSTTPALGARWSAPQCMSLASRERTFLWLRPTDDFYELGVVRAPDSRSPSVVPPVPFAVARRVAALDPAQRCASWARWFAERLRRSPRTPLSPGRWRLSPTALDGRCVDHALPASAVRDALAQGRFHVLDWDHGQRVPPLLLRDPSAATSGRVKAYRKLAREGTLPPVLLLWFSGAATPVVLDGHDRLVACAAEQSPAPALCLVPVVAEEASPSADRVEAAVGRQLAAIARSHRPPRDPTKTTERMNAQLMRAFHAPPRWRTSTALPAPGGWPAWLAAVDRHAEALPDWFVAPPREQRLS